MSALQQFAQTSNDLGLEIYRSCSPDRNLCFSPFSLTASVLSSRAEDAFYSTLKPRWRAVVLNSDQIQASYAQLIDALPGSTLVSTAVLIQEGHLVSPNINHATIPVDFHDGPAAVKAANAWASHATQGKMCRVVDDFPPLTRICTMNAVYFQANWKQPFKRTYTSLGMFRVNHTTPSRTTFMKQRGDFPFTRHADCDIIEMPYEDGATVMMIYLPHDVEGLARLEEAITPAVIRQDMDSLELRGPRNVCIPVFTTECILNVGHLMYDDPTVSVGQTTYVRVDEEGTTAAAVTALCGGGYTPPVPEFRADHPFLYVIMNKPTKTILFMGRLKYPDAPIEHLCSQEKNIFLPPEKKKLQNPVLLRGGSCNSQ